MTKSSENWQDYPYLVEWVESANNWARECEIYEFMPADEEGLDPSGQFSRDDGYPGLPKFTTQSTGGYGGEGSLIWTFGDGSERSILSKFYIGAASSWATFGWYLGRIPHTDKVEGFEQQIKVCSNCEYQGSYFDGDTEVECLACLESPIWINLEHSVGPDGIMTFTGSAFYLG